MERINSITFSTNRSIDSIFIIFTFLNFVTWSCQVFDCTWKQNNFCILPDLPALRFLLRRHLRIQVWKQLHRKDHQRWRRWPCPDLHWKGRRWYGSCHPCWSQGEQNIIKILFIQKFQISSNVVSSLQDHVNISGKLYL